MFSIKEILDLAVQIEKNGEATYRQAARRITHPVLVPLLEWLADEEARHAAWFAEKALVAADTFQTPVLEELNQGLLTQLVAGQSFSLEDADFTNMQTVAQLLAVSVAFEEDTVLFYEMLKPFIEDPATQAQLEAIIAEENRHIEKLQTFLESEAGVADAYR
ncbi:MAG TPA: ferritin family protein [Desulfobacterales bacterium]|nr:ferritin family protein [Desulfobacterales bacterium]